MCVGSGAEAMHRGVARGTPGAGHPPRSASSRYPPRVRPALAGHHQGVRSLGRSGGPAPPPRPPPPPSPPEFRPPSADLPRAADPSAGPGGPIGATTQRGPFPHHEGPMEGEEPPALGFLEPPSEPGSLGRLGHYEV